MTLLAQLLASVGVNDPQPNPNPTHFASVVLLAIGTACGIALWWWGQILGWQDSVAACNVVLKQAGQLWPERSAVVQGVVDPDSGMKYHAELVKREQL